MLPLWQWYHGGGYTHPSSESTNTNSLLSISLSDSKLVSRLGNSTISLSSSGVDTSLDDDDDVEGEGDDVEVEVEVVEDVVVLGMSKSTIEAALEAAAWTSRGELEAGRGSDPASSGKLRMAELPLMLKAATSWARAAISAVEKVPSQIRFFFLGSRISDTHLPHVRIRTPL